MCSCLPDSFWTVPCRSQDMVKGKRNVWDGTALRCKNALPCP